jgi:hypothetical protein
MVQFRLPAWYSDAVGNGTTGAFFVGDGDPPPHDVCVFGGVLTDIFLELSWDETHSFGGYGDRTDTDVWR